MQVTIPLEEMLGIIAQENGIIGFNLATFEQESGRYTPRRPKIIPIKAGCLFGELQAWRHLTKKHDELVGITSDVTLEGGKHRHLCMLDFGSPGLWKRLTGLFRKRKFSHYDILSDEGLTRGFIVDSGNSYHFYGSSLMTDQQWREMLSRHETHVKYTGVYGGPVYSDEGSVDALWARTQLARGYSLLRLTTNSEKPKQPVVVEARGYKLVPA